MKIQGTLTSWKLQSQLQPMTEEFDLPSLHTSHRVTPVDPVAQREEGRERQRTGQGRWTDPSTDLLVQGWPE